MRQKSIYLLFAISLFVIELAIAFFPSAYFIRPYFGDFLVVMLIYCVVKALIDVDPMRLTLGVFLFSVAIETAQYFHLADALEIKNQIIRIIIGTSFSWIDILMYFLGCIAMYYIDVLWITGKADRPRPNYKHEER